MGATQVGISSCLLTLTGPKTILHYTSKSLVFPFEVVVIGTVIQKMQLNRQLYTDSPFLVRIKNDVMINIHVEIGPWPPDTLHKWCKSTCMSMSIEHIIFIVHCMDMHTRPHLDRSKWRKLLYCDGTLLECLQCVTL